MIVDGDQSAIFDIALPRKFTNHDDFAQTVWYLSLDFPRLTIS